MGRLQGRGCSRQGAPDARERSWPPGFDHLQRAGPDLLRPLDVQARRGGRRGALGAILVHTPESATYGWDVVRGSWSVEQFKLDRPAPHSIAFAAWVTHDAAQAALARANLNLDSLTRAAARREFRPVATGINVV